MYPFTYNDFLFDPITTNRRCSLHHQPSSNFGLRTVLSMDREHLFFSFLLRLDIIYCLCTFKLSFHLTTDHSAVYSEGSRITINLEQFILQHLSDTTYHESTQGRIRTPNVHFRGSLPRLVPPRRDRSRRPREQVNRRPRPPELPPRGRHKAVRVTEG